MQIVAVLVMFPAFFCMVSFMSAATPEQAAIEGESMPATWSAGVLTGRNYYEWYTIADAPVLFGISIALLVYCSVIFLWTALKRSTTSPPLVR